MEHDVIKTLVVLGNGFDLKCNLKSKFQNFFDSFDVDFDSIYKFFKSDVTELVLPSDVMVGSWGAEIGSTKFSAYNIYVLKGGDTTKFKISDEFSYLNPDKKFLKAGFWTLYFMIFSDKVNAWYDIEYILRDFFVTRSNSFGKADNNLIANNGGMTRFEALKQYLKDIDKRTGEKGAPQYLNAEEKNDNDTKKIALLLINTYGYRSNQVLSDFLLQQLYVFESLLNEYLRKEVLQANAYRTLTRRCLGALTSNTRYNLLNFNYTQPQDDQQNVTRNIHSTLDNGPIIGIDSNEVIASSEVFKFTKTYRIMKLAIKEGKSELMPSTLDKIVFYGHSLASADYSYFQSIFDICNIYDNNITLVFYYSGFEDWPAEKEAEVQFNRVSNLLENYGKTIPNHGKNLLPKLLLEDRIKIIEL